MPTWYVLGAVRTFVISLFALLFSLSPSYGDKPARKDARSKSARAADAQSLAEIVQAAATPGLPEFNRRVLEYAATYRPRSFGGYSWPAPRGTQGMTRDLYLGEHRIARGSRRGNHCVGLTFEVFWRALSSSLGGLEGSGLTPESAARLMRIWFVPDDRGKGPARALPTFGLGRAIAADAALPGDFVQVWMNNGRGHSMVFLSWLRDGDRIVGMRYWSTQPWTDGIGLYAHRIGEGARDIDPDAIFLARVVLRSSSGSGPKNTQ